MLTNLQCAKAMPREKTYRLSDGRGLYLEVMPNGSRYWRFKYRHSGKEKRLAFGVYPDVTLARAREKREEARRLVADGIDPAAAKKEAQRQALLVSEMTFERVAREWHELYKDRWSEGYGRTILHRMEMDIFPSLGKRPVSAIYAPELLETIRKIEVRGAHEMASPPASAAHK